jgi:membrane protease subunit (stomatin/prohibitin family)
MNNDIATELINALVEKIASAVMVKVEERLKGFGTDEYAIAKVVDKKIEEIDWSDKIAEHIDMDEIRSGIDVDGLVVAAIDDLTFEVRVR